MYDFSNYFVKLYDTVLEKERRKFKVSDTSIKKAIRVMKEAYLPDPSWSSKASSNSHVTNYNDPAFRCAYLHKYAMCYTGMMRHFLQMAIDARYEIRQKLSRVSTVCSLGGGPGTDIVGLLAALSGEFGAVPCSISVIDLAVQWGTTFYSIVEELSSGQYGRLSVIASKVLHCEYLGTNLLANWITDRPILRAAATADVVTMVKFISAAACNNNTEAMVERVFNSMRPGAMLVFIDNAAGGFDQLVQEVAHDRGLISLYGPLVHSDYENSRFNINRFGYASQSKTKVTFQVFQKPLKMPYSFSNSALRGKRRPNIYRVSYNPESSVRAQEQGLNRQQQPIRHEEPSTLYGLLMLIVILFIVFYLFSNKN